MRMFPTNTPLDQWLTTWIIHEVESIVDEKHPGLRHQYSAMSRTQRLAHGLPVTRQECIQYIRQHRGNKYD